MKSQLIGIVLILFLLTGKTAIGQSDRNRTPEVHPDRRITFTISAPTAHTVNLYFGEWNVEPQPLDKDENGIWSITIGPVEPKLYGYYFTVDDARVIDGKNPMVKIGSTILFSSLVDVPGNPPRFDQWQDVSHGTMHIMHYIATSQNRRKTMYIYTPPDYYTNITERYPILYLRHGGGDYEGSWSNEGRAGVIADNLIAKGEAKPLIIVMTNGHVDPLGSGSNEGSTPEAISQLTHELLHDIIPLVEQSFRTLDGRENRAIAGLSMGAGQAFTIGLNNLDTFAWVGEFSSGMLSRTPEIEVFDQSEPAQQPLQQLVPALYSDPDIVNSQLELLWLGCGIDDTRYNGQVKFVGMLDDLGISHYPFTSIPGGHEWKVWRNFLNDFLQLIF